MKKRLCGILLMLALFSACQPMKPTATLQPEPAPADLPGWTLIWSDEFDGPAGAGPDAAKWTFDLGGQGWGNNEWQFYTARPENAALDGEGALAITARPVESLLPGMECWYGPCRYTSARLLSRGLFEFIYGRVEARLQLPYGQGVWPAFWMLGADITETGWPNCGEIDIMENIGRELSTVYGTVHGPGYSGAGGISTAFTLDDGTAFKDQYHVFALEWEPDELRWYVDDHLYATLHKSQFPADKRWVFDHDFFLILNVAVGGNWPGYPDERTTFPQTMRVDYVRVYQRP
jgi:beta-glucanase (GH16 family)